MGRERDSGISCSPDKEVEPEMGRERDTAVWRIPDTEVGRAEGLGKVFMRIYKIDIC